MSRSPSPEPRPKKVTPFLCRVFIKSNGYHPIEAFQEPQGLPISDEYGVYAWKSSTLSTILASLYPSLPPALQNPATRFAFRTVYFDGRAAATAAGEDRDRGDKARAWKSRELGRIDARDLVRQLGDMDNAKTLDEHRYQPGDYLCISAQLPESSMSGMAPPLSRGTMSIRQQGGLPVPPQSHLGGGAGFSGREPAPTESWIDARREHGPPSSAAARGGFGIRGRGARGGAAGGGGGGWGRRRSASPSRRPSTSGDGNGWGNSKPVADDGWGAVPSRADGGGANDGWGAVPRGEDKGSTAGWGAKVEGW